MIEPKMDFVEKVCNETWTLEDGKITVQPPGKQRFGCWTGRLFKKNDGDVAKFEEMLKDLWWKVPHYSHTLLHISFSFMHRSRSF